MIWKPIFFRQKTEKIFPVKYDAFVMVYGLSNISATLLNGLKVIFFRQNPKQSCSVQYTCLMRNSCESCHFSIQSVIYSLIHCRYAACMPSIDTVLNFSFS